jgi:putative membrane protein
MVESVATERRRPMLTDLILAIFHHLLMFLLLAVLVMEIMLVRPGMSAAQLKRVSALDSSYGGIAGLILVVGFLRVFLGIKGPDFYLENPWFWAKIAAFLVVGALSVAPTMQMLSWRGELRRNPAFSPDPDEVQKAKRFMHLKAMVFILIPIFAALMARAYGL